MKPLLLAPLLVGAVLQVQAQQLPTAPAATVRAPTARTEEYCMLNAWHKLNGKVNISIDYGQRQKLFSANVFLDEAGRPVEFNSVIDALNWLNSQGWEFVNAYGDEGDKASHYIMRRRIAF